MSGNFDIKIKSYGEISHPCLNPHTGEAGHQVYLLLKFGDVVSNQEIILKIFSLSNLYLNTISAKKY